METRKSEKYDKKATGSIFKTGEGNILDTTIRTKRVKIESITKEKTLSQKSPPAFSNLPSASYFGINRGKTSGKPMRKILPIIKETPAAAKYNPTLLFER